MLAQPEPPNYKKQHAKPLNRDKKQLALLAAHGAVIRLDQADAQ